MKFEVDKISSFKKIEVKDIFYRKLVKGHRFIILTCISGTYYLIDLADGFPIIYSNDKNIIIEHLEEFNYILVTDRVTLKLECQE